MRPLLILNDTRPNSDWPEQKLIEMEINKPMRTHWLKQLKSPVDVARNTGDLSPQMIVSGVSVFLSSLSSAPHLLSASQTGSLIISYNSGTVARISGGLHPSRFKNSRKKKGELSVFVPTFPVSPVITLIAMASVMYIPATYYYVQKNEMAWARPHVKFPGVPFRPHGQ